MQALSHEIPLLGSVVGLKFALRLIRAKPFQLKLRAKVLTRPFSKCAKHKYNSDPYLECLVRNLAVSSNNPSGTCKMGAVEDNSTVVDPQLRVKGIQRLRVVDASVMPTPVTGNTYAPVVMIAEKASDLIRKTYSQEVKGQQKQGKKVQKKPKR